MDGLTRRAFLGAAGAGLAAAGCGSLPDASVRDLAEQGRAAAGDGSRYDGPPVELQFWNGFTGGDGPFMLEFVEAFNREQPNIDVRMNVILWVDYYQKTTSAVAAGKGPDLGIMQLDQVPTAAAHRVIVPLDDVARSLRLQRADFAPSVWDAGIVGGRRYGIPLDVHPLGLYGNTAMLAEAGLDEGRLPRDREEYLAALEALKRKGLRGSWVSPFLFTGALWFQSLLAQFGGSLYDREVTRATWDAEPGVEALSFMRGLVDRGYSAPNVGQDADAIAFKNGENAFIWNGSWALNEYGGIPELKWKVDTVPRIGPRRAVWGNSHNFVVMRQPGGDENRLRAAATFIDYVSRRSLKWTASGMVPARRSVRSDPAFAKEYADQATFAEQLPYVVFPPPVPGIDDVRKLSLDVAINRAVLGKERPRDALRDAAKRGGALLEQNRQKYGTAI